MLRKTREEKRSLGSDQLINFAVKILQIQENQLNINWDEFLYIFIL